MYLEFLVRDLLALLHNLPANNQTRDVWLQQGKVSAQFSQVRAILKNAYKNPLIGRGETVDGLRALPT